MREDERPFGARRPKALLRERGQLLAYKGEQLFGLLFFAKREFCSREGRNGPLEPAKNGVNPGKGHHHLLIDVPIPADLSKRIGKDSNHVHMGDGSKCKTLNLAKGQHTITALFAQGNHVPYNPVVTDAVTVTVTHVK